MMRQNYHLTIAYDGSRYYGWEHQPEQPLTIQGMLEQALLSYVGEPIEIFGAGRTDAGVHARGMSAHARLWEMNDDRRMRSDEEIREGINAHLPEDIRVVEIRRAGKGFHARYNALGKTYRYTCYVGENKPVFERKYVYTLNEKPDIERMRKAAEILVGEHDFASFCTNAKEMKSTVRRVDLIEIRLEGSYLTFTYHGSGFLQHMVRILTGTLLEVGFHKREILDMKVLLEKGERASAGFMAPAKGLCLEKVDYH